MCGCKMGPPVNAAERLHAQPPNQATTRAVARYCPLTRKRVITVVDYDATDHKDSAQVDGEPRLHRPLAFGAVARHIAGRVAIHRVQGIAGSGSGLLPGKLALRQLIWAHCSITRGSQGVLVHWWVCESAGQSLGVVWMGVQGLEQALHMP